MQVGDQGIHLLLCHLIGKRRHHSLARHEHPFDFCIGCRSAIWQCIALEEAVQIGWNLLEVQVVLFVAMSASHVVQVLALRLPRREARRRVTTHAWSRNRSREDRHPANFQKHRWLRFLGKLAADKVPVDHLEEGFHVIRPEIMVLEIVRVLPHVDAGDRMVAGGQRAVLVGRGFNGQ